MAPDHLVATDSLPACCVALTAEPLAEADARQLAGGFRALGDPHRINIVHLLAVAGEPVCVVDIERHLPVVQSTVSYHLKALVDAHLLSVERRGRWSYYRLSINNLAALAVALECYAARRST